MGRSSSGRWTKKKEDGPVENGEKSQDPETEIKDEAGEVKEEALEENSRSRRKRKPINIEEVEAKIKAEEEESKAEPSEAESAADKTEEDKLEEYAELARAFQPTGNTLDTTTVKTKVPFLLRHTLRASLT